MSILKLFIGIIFFALAFGIGVWFFIQNKSLDKTQKIISPASEDNYIQPTPKPLDKYSFEKMAKSDFVPSQIKVYKEYQQIGVVKPDWGGTTGLFSYQYQDKKVSGVINLPEEIKVKFASGSATISANKKYPVIILIRGFVPVESYISGIGSQPIAQYLAKNGFVTLSPDFLGFGDSDMPDDSVWAERFSRLGQVLTLQKSLRTLDFVDDTKTAIWGHSNGGQVALSVLEVSGENWPMVLWAPVSKPFPYSILYFTDEYDDQGKALRKSLADFEKDYDVRKYSITDYLGWIKAPIQLHQGLSDDAVPFKWSRELDKNLQDQKISVKYFEYPDSDHNMRPDWDTVAKRTLDFYRKEIK